MLTGVYQFLYIKKFNILKEFPLLFVITCNITNYDAYLLELELL